MGVTLTQSAADHVASQLASRGKGLGIRLGVTTSGCSGMAYVLEFVDEPAPEDQVFEGHGVKIYIDPKSLVYLEGDITRIPSNTVKLEGKEAASMVKMMDRLEDNEDVQNVYANHDIDPALLEELTS